MKKQSDDRNPPSANLVDMISNIAEMQRVYAGILRPAAASERGSIVVSSALATEGKTLSACGMAMLVARQGDKRVLVVDLNWYRPALHSVFGLEQTFTIDNLLENVNIDDLVQKSKTDHLDVLVAPIQEKSNMMTGQQLNSLAEKIIKRARQGYDVSIIDSSAIYPTNRCMVDPGVFANQADGVLLVVRANATPRKYVKRAVMALETSGANILGVVFNRCERRDGS